VTREVLYRKWRPSRFADIVGQPAMIQTLRQAVATGRVAHAYLLCGPRGTGKTTTARVLAKALNCLERPDGTGDPCGRCAICQANDQGNFTDLIEIDAASHRGIDEIRSLREKVHFMPSQAGTKVYIIDEAHMLTDAAFNAFLKTLEEPPSHTVFVLCTTEPHKLPVTIVSRCQRFDLHRIATDDVADRLSEIASAEGAEASPDALRMVARAATGSLRDAINLLDQLITSYGSSISDESVREMLGIGDEAQAVALVQHLLANDTAGALEVINVVAAEGVDLRPLHRMTVECLRAALLMKSGVKEVVDLSPEVRQEMAQLASRVPMDLILRALSLFGQVSLKHDQPSPLPLELATVELSMEPEIVPAPLAPAPRVPSGPVGRAPSQQAPAPREAPPKPVAAPPPAAPPQRAVDRSAMTPAAETAPFDAAASPEEQLDAQWSAIVRSLSKQPGKRFNVGALLRSSKVHFLDGSEVVVRFAHRSNSERLQEEMDDPNCRMATEQVLQSTLGGPYSIRVETDENGAGARSGPPSSHLVRAALNMGGQVVPKSRDPDPWEQATDEQKPS
jgi:DNA polymerase-3 subunit gamma/tau